MQTTSGAVRVADKVRAARKLIESCISPHGMGIWASQGRYANQLWTRDLALAAAPALKLMGRLDVVGAHLDQLVQRQQPSGKISILFSDDPQKLLETKEREAVQKGKPGFILLALKAQGIEDLSPWTKDSEFLFVKTMLEYPDAPMVTPTRLRHEAVEKALAYSLSQTKNGLAQGAERRDTNVWLNDACLLSNNCLLYQARKLNGLNDRSLLDFRCDIVFSFWTGTSYRDYLGVDTADTFGQALGVIYDVIPKERWPAVLESFAKLHTPRGYLTNDCRPNPTTDEERELLKSMPQSFVLWPFIHGYAILALLKMGERELAMQAFNEYTNLEGFWEFFDPKTGKGYGAQEQLWSACLYLIAADALGINV